MSRHYRDESSGGCLFFIALFVGFVTCAVNGCSNGNTPPTCRYAIVSLYAQNGAVERRYKADVRNGEVNFDGSNLCEFVNADTRQDVTISAPHQEITVDYGAWGQEINL